MQFLCHLPIVSGALITDPTWIFFVVLCIILFAPLLLRRLHIPHVIGLILSGVLIGEYGFNILERDSSFELFGQVGIYYIMFLAGLELDMGSVEQYGRRGVRFGFLTFAIPFVLGYVTSHFVLHYGTLTSILISCIYSSHTLVSYPIVGRYGMGRHRDVVISVVATAFSIFAALLVLAVVVGSLKPDNSWLRWFFFMLRCASYGAFVIFFFPRMGRWFLRRFSDSVMQYIFILALVFLSASLAKLVGLEGLLGAFLAGLVINRLVPKTSPLMTRIEFVGNALFIPYFLIGVGMLVDVSIMFSNLQTLWIILVMVVTGSLGKLLAAFLMSYSTRSGSASAWLMFGLTNAHAAGALAIVMIGTLPGVGLIDDQILGGTVMLILFSCIISSFATSYGARKLALSDTSLEDNRGSYHGKCLVTYSQSANVDLITQLAMLIRNPYIPDSLMGLTVAYDSQASDGSDQQRKGKMLLEQAQSIAAAADVYMATISRLSTNVAGGIIHTIKEYDCGEVIVNLEDRTTGMPKASLGNIIDDVLSGTHREVMAVRCIVPPGTIRRTIIAVPQNAEYEVGFYKWIEHICRIGEQLDCHLEYHAHHDTLPYIAGYMSNKHPNVRSEYHEMNRWTQILNLEGSLGKSTMLVLVTARQGFISYQGIMDNLPMQIHRYFGHTSVMLLYPDQWGEPLESVSVFTPNGTAVTRQPRSIASWLRSKFLTISCTSLLLFSFFGTTASASDAGSEKMSPLVRRAALEQRAVRRSPATRGMGMDRRRIMALVRTDSRDILHEYGAETFHSWGNIHAAAIPLSRLDDLAMRPEILRIEAGQRPTVQMDTARIVTRTDGLHHGTAGLPMPYTGKGVVVGLMDIGFDLTHPTFYSSDMERYRIDRFWDMLDFEGSSPGASPMFLGSEYTTVEDILAKAHSTDGLIQFHGTHTAGTAAGSGFGSPYAGSAPEADICLVSNAVGGDEELIPDSLEYMFTSATDLLGFQYIFDYADHVGKPAVISFSEGRHQDLWGDDVLGYEVLDSLVRRGRIICAAAGNESVYDTYMHKPAGKERAQTLCLFSSKAGYYLFRSSDRTEIGLTFFDNNARPLHSISVHTDSILACQDSLYSDTLQVADKTYQILMTAYPSCYDSTQWATELYLCRLTKHPSHTVGITISGKEQDVEAFSVSSYFKSDASFPDYCDAETSHNVHFPGSSPSVICVGSTAYRTGVFNYDGEWRVVDFGTEGVRAGYSSIGPTIAGICKPDVMAPGVNVVSAFNSYFEQSPDSWDANMDVMRFEYGGRQYSWNAQCGTSMSCPIVAGIVALWLQALPWLSREDVIEALEATSHRHDTSLEYPNAEYGYGEIDAEAGLRFLIDRYDGIPGVDSAPRPSTEAAYDLLGRRISLSAHRHGIYVIGGKKVVR